MITENIKNTSVYLIKAGQTDNYKIGIATDAKKRLSNLQTAHYEKLLIVHSSNYPTRFIALAVEALLHEKYKEFNTIGEWFKFELTHIEKVKTELDSEVSEVTLLRARIKELEFKVLESKTPPPKQPNHTTTQTPPPTKFNLISLLWSNQKAESKLTPKVRVINVKKRREVEALSKTYKYLLSKGYIELRGNQGYYALVDFDVAIKGVK